MSTSHRLSSLIFTGFIAMALVACAPTENRRSSGSYIDDAMTTARVKTKLIADPQVNANAINVETFRGTVQLSGFVSSEQQIQEAVNLARTVEGVNQVRNALVVRETVPEN